MLEKRKGLLQKKTKEALAVQGEAFADRAMYETIWGIKNASDRNEKLAKARPLKDIDTLLSYSKLFAEGAVSLDNNGNPVLSAEVPTKIATIVKNNWQNYVAFLRAEKAEMFNYREECHRVYEQKFKKVIQPILDQIHAIPGAITIVVADEVKKQIEQIPGYIATGTEGYIFEIEVDGIAYIMKKFYGDYNVAPLMVETDQLLAHLRTQDVPQVQHLVGYSRDDHTFILSFMEGSEIGEFELGELDTFPKNHVRKMINTCMALSDRGLLVDYHYEGGNFIYNEDEGVNFIDLTLAYEGQCWADWLVQVRDGLSVRSQSDKKQVWKGLAQRLGKTMVEILQEDYPGRVQKYPQVLAALMR